MFSLFQIPSLRYILKVLTHKISPTQFERDAIQENDKVPSAEDIRAVINDLLSQCQIPFYRTPYDHELHDLCIQECKLKGYPINEANGKPSILKYIPSGVIMSSTAYAHLKNQSTQVFIAIYTAAMIWVDDVYTGNVRGLDCFNDRFVTGQKQANEVLDGIARLFRETHLHYSGAQAHVILTSSLNFITATILEFDTKGIPVSPYAKSYATFQRIMSGICESYAMFIFPPEVPMKAYIKAVPELCLAVNYFNDVLSFYKEELAGENGNYISNEASLRGENKIPVFRELAGDVSLCVSRIANSLEGSGEAEDVFQYFVGGYVSFHTSFDLRYHLNDLFPLQ